jgi:energy-coupling factor transporter ATP-binding protein EcfA2
VSEPIICVENLSYAYEGTENLVIRDLSFTISEGEFVAIMGPSGAGKTTLGLALNGIVPNFMGGRFYGAVRLLGSDTLDLSVAELAQNVGMVFQDPETQLVANTVEDEIAFGLENVKIPPDEIRRRIDEVLKIVRLEGYEEKHPNSLSGGQKQRLAIAAALALRPKVMILDEPTSQLDPIGSEEVFAVIRSLNEEYGMTVILVTHDSERVAEYADRVLLMHEGRLLADCTPADLFQQSELLKQTAVRAPQVTEFFAGFSQTVRPLPCLPTCLPAAVEQLQAVWPEVTFEPQTYADASCTEHGEAIISVRDLHFTYPDGTQALTGVSLDVHAGECVAIIGQNGGGKSTLLKHFLHLLKPTAGEVKVFGRDVGEYTVSQLARRIGYVYQNPDNQIFSKTVGDEVRFGPANQIKDKEEVERRVRTALEEMDLLDVADEHPLALSKGDRERVAVAAVLALDPEVLIFDEPTTGQDYAGARLIMNMIRRLHRQGRTILVITHHLYLLPGFVDRVVLMGDGEILLDAPIRQVFNQIDLLRQTYLVPPQIVEFVQEVGRIGQACLNALTVGEALGLFGTQGCER